MAEGMAVDFRTTAQYNAMASLTLSNGRARLAKKILWDTVRTWIVLQLLLQSMEKLLL